MDVFLKAARYLFGETVQDETFELLESAGRFQTVGEVFPLGVLAGLTHGLAEAVGALRTPPGFAILTQSAVRELFNDTRYYNGSRRHSSLGYVSSAEFESQLTAQKVRE